MSDAEIANMTYNDKCKMLNSNPVIVGKHFQYRLKCLFKDVLLGSGDPVGKILHDAIRIEFQFKDSPHALCFIWIKDCPILNEENIGDFIRFIDKHVSAVLPDIVTCPVLHNLVKTYTYQTHTHSKTCIKYKNLACRFNFDHFFTEKTIVAEPLHTSIDKAEKNRVFENRECILTKVKKFFDKFLNPSDKVNYSPDMTVDDVLHYLHIDKSEYFNCLSIASSVDYEIHLKHPPNSCFINNYNPTVLFAWQASMDIQQVSIIISMLHICVHICQRVEHIVLRQLELLPKRQKRTSWV